MVKYWELQNLYMSMMSYKKESRKKTKELMKIISNGIRNYHSSGTFQEVGSELE